jgi:hypothetical protein
MGETSIHGEWQNRVQTTYDILASTTPAVTTKNAYPLVSPYRLTEGSVPSTPPCERKMVLSAAEVLGRDRTTEGTALVLKDFKLALKGGQNTAQGSSCVLAIAEQRCRR